MAGGARVYGEHGGKLRGAVADTVACAAAGAAADTVARAATCARHAAVSADEGWRVSNTRGTDGSPVGGGESLDECANSEGNEEELPS